MSWDWRARAALRDYYLELLPGELASESSRAWDTEPPTPEQMRTAVTEWKRRVEGPVEFDNKSKTYVQNIYTHDKKHIVETFIQPAAFPPGRFGSFYAFLKFVGYVPAKD